MSAAAITYLASGSSFPEAIKSLEGVASYPILWNSCKFVMAFPLVYHMVNGIRHLVSQRRVGNGRLGREYGRVCVDKLHIVLGLEGAANLTLPSSQHTQTWDTGRAFDIPLIRKAGYAVVTVAVLTTLGLLWYTPAK